VDVGRRSGSTVGGLMSTTVAVGRRLTPAVALELEAAVGLRDNGARVGGWGGDHLGLSGAAGVRVAANGLVGPVLAARLGYDHQATSWSTPWDGDVSGSRAQGRETLGWVYGDVRVGVEGRWRWLSASAALRLTTGPVVTSACHVDVMEAEPDSLLYRAAQAELPSWLVTGGWDVRVAASF